MAHRDIRISGYATIVGADRTKLLIESPAMVLVLADSAISDGFGIVHTMVDGLEGAQVGEDGLEIVIGHLPEEPPWHDRADLPCSDLTSVHGL